MPGLDPWEPWPARLAESMFLHRRLDLQATASCTKARSRDHADRYEYLPDTTERRDDWAVWEAMMASPSTSIMSNAWDALAGRLTPAQREAAMRPGSTLVLAGAGTGKTSTLTASVVHKIEVEKFLASMGSLPMQRTWSANLCSASCLRV